MKIKNYKRMLQQWDRADRAERRRDQLFLLGHLLLLLLQLILCGQLVYLIYILVA